MGNIQYHIIWEHALCTYAKCSWEYSKYVYVMDSVFKELTVYGTEGKKVPCIFLFYLATPIADLANHSLLS